MCISHVYLYLLQYFIFCLYIKYSYEQHCVCVWEKLILETRFLSWPVRAHITMRKEFTGRGIGKYNSNKTRYVSGVIFSVVSQTWWLGYIWYVDMKSAVSLHVVLFLHSLVIHRKNLTQRTNKAFPTIFLSTEAHSFVNGWKKKIQKKFWPGVWPRTESLNRLGAETAAAALI